MDENGLRSYYGAIYIIYLIVGILATLTIAGAIIGIPFIIGANKFKKAETLPMGQILTERSSLYAWGLVFGIFTMPWGVITIIYTISANTLLLKIEGQNQLAHSKGQKLEGSNQQKGNVKHSENKEEESSAMAKLESAKKLFEEGNISKEEYDSLRKKILNI